MNLKENCDYMLMSGGHFPSVFYTNMLFVHSINLEHFKATIFIKDETQHFVWQYSIIMGTVVKQIHKH